MKKTGYNTGGKTAVIEFFRSHKDRQFTADDVMEELRRRSTASGEKLIGKSSLYRIIAGYEKKGVLHCHVDSETSKRLYRYLGDGCDSHFHLKCSECGKVIHLECEIGDRLLEHISSDHGFSVFAGRSMLYGECESCIKKRGST